MAISESVSFGKTKHRKKVATKDRIFNVFLYVILVAFAITIIYPLVHMLACSFSDSLSIVRGEVSIIPRGFSIKYYTELFEHHYWLGHGFLISLLRTVIGTATSLFCSALLAFILSRKKFMFKSGLSIFWAVTLVLNGGFVSTYLMYKYINLHNTFWVYIVPCLVSVFYMFVIRSYMQTIPDSLEEAAQLEGAGYMRIFWSVITPMCKPVYAAVAFFIAAYHWNSWFDVFAFNRMEPEYTTVQFELMKLFRELTMSRDVESWRASTPYGERNAAYLLGALPLLIAYPFFQKFFITGLTFKGIKE